MHNITSVPIDMKQERNIQTSWKTQNETKICIQRKQETARNWKSVKNPRMTLGSNVSPVEILPPLLTPTTDTAINNQNNRPSHNIRGPSKNFFPLCLVNEFCSKMLRERMNFHHNTPPTAN